ncbi:MAG: helix-turn-helix domain-containing protein [Phycisphaerales bacterium]|nr:MAG: helix-turn-helix domain-containing protein [Phycisphaerales bacterium]
MRGNIGLDRETFDRLAWEYQRAFRVDLCAITQEGDVVFGHVPRFEQDNEGHRHARRAAVQDALRWGESTVVACGRNRLQWAVPLMRNQELIGGLVASATERRVFAGGAGRPPLDIRLACTQLRELAERENLTNASALEQRRQEYLSEQQRAYAIHAYKAASVSNIRHLYLKEEPALFSAVRTADHRQAREILNRILFAIYQQASGRLDLTKSFLLELVVSMTRSAVEGGGNPEELLGTNFARMTDLSRVDSEEKLTHWVTGMLEHLMEACRRNRQRDTGVLLFDALAYMERHCCERVSRDDVARAAHLSPSYFSYLLRKESGATFTELLNRMRIGRAAELIVNGNLPMKAVVAETGFKDQSYFTKVFKRYRKLTPKQFRRQFAGRGDPPNQLAR